MSIADPHKQASAGPHFFYFMLAGFIGSVLFLVYSAPITNGYTGVGFLFAVPFFLGGLFTGIGSFSFQSIGCVFAPILLFAILFPFAYFGLGEGIACIIMILPFWLAAGLGGGLAAWMIKRRLMTIENSNASTKIQASALLAIPFLLVFYEDANPPVWTEHQVIRSVEIDGNTEQIYPLLVTLPKIEQSEGKATFTHDFVGIPRPSKAQLINRNGQLVRAAKWGDEIGFEEHITALIPNKEISWRFVFPDSTIQQHTDKHIAPDGPVLKIANGGYRVKTQDNGKVLLTLSTQYRMRTRFTWYFEAWGELFLGDIQSNVLTIIKARAETK